MTLDLALRFIILLVRGAFDLNEKRMNATAHDQNILHVDTLYSIIISVTMNINTSTRTLDPPPFLYDNNPFFQNGIKPHKLLYFLFQKDMCLKCCCSKI